MAKIPFSKLNLTKDETVHSFQWFDNLITVKQFLPMEDKLEMMTKVINESVDENNFYNPCRLDIYFLIELIAYYADISFTDKQRENPSKLFDLLTSSGFADTVIAEIPEKEYKLLKSSIEAAIENIYKYHNSARGLLAAIRTDYENVDMNVDELQEKIANPEALTFVKDVLDKLG